MPLPDLPVIAICGFKNAGKTTLLEQIVPRLRADGLAVGVLKHDAHGLQIDHEGKDSDPLFGAGADVFVSGPNKSFARWHPSSRQSAGGALAFLLERNDVVLVEGHKTSPWPKIWLDGSDGQPPPAMVESIGLRLAGDGDRVTPSISWIQERVRTMWCRRPCRGAVLIGGESRRMGSPKHLIVHQGMTLSERAVLALGEHLQQLVMVGGGELPPDLEQLDRLPDPPGLRGPIAGLLAVMRWSPDAAWVVSACDMPRIRPAAVEWLMSHRRPGVWAVMPRLAGGKLEPTFALYEPQARHLLENLVALGRWGPCHLADHPHVIEPPPPPELEDAWSNFNTPEQIDDSSSSNV